MHLGWMSEYSLIFKQFDAETCVRFDAAHLSINLVLEIAVPMFPTLIVVHVCMHRVPHVVPY